MDNRIKLLIRLGENIRDKILSEFKKNRAGLSHVHAHCDEDTIYAIDHIVDQMIVSFVDEHKDELGNPILMAEGIKYSKDDLNSGRPVLIIDPIDGTREIMYNKRSAFFLAGYAEKHNGEPRFSDLSAAVMVELPTSKAMYADVLWSLKGKGVEAFTRNLVDKRQVSWKVTPDKSGNLLHGFGQFCRFFTQGKGLLATMEEELINRLYPEIEDGKAIVFEDQYLTSAGLIFDMMRGNNRFVADIRASLYKMMRSKGLKAGLTCHPYDLSMLLIAGEAGIEVTNIDGDANDFPLDLTTEVDFIAYANKDMREHIEPELKKVLAKYI